MRGILQQVNNALESLNPLKASLVYGIFLQFSFSKGKKRKQMFESIYQSGDIKGICQLVKLLYVEPTFFAKPMSLTDKNFLNRIRTNLFDEFAVALQIKPTEVENFVRQYLL